MVVVENITIQSGWDILVILLLLRKQSKITVILHHFMYLGRILLNANVCKVSISDLRHTEFPDTCNIESVSSKHKCLVLSHTQ